MKGMFPEYEINRQINYASAWKDAVFVFDTNVLLNLYRYRISTRDELFSVLDRISKQIWIPYQVALEFQRNRLSVIAEQTRRFSEVKRTVEKAKVGLNSELAKLKLQERHSVINPEPLVKGFEELTTNFFSELEKLEKKHRGISERDELKDRLEALFEGKVGDKFEKQEDLDALYKKAEIRYKFKVPPGYEDDQKDSKSSDEYMHSGLIYKRKYGDFVIWEQTLMYCKSIGRKTLVFVTDDAKEDWWRIIDVDGPKTIGPRAELLDEARRVGEIDIFLMYSPDKFLKYANETLHAKISEAAIQEVKDISADRVKNKREQLKEFATRGRAALRHWLGTNSDTVIEHEGYLGITAVRNNSRYTYMVDAAGSFQTPGTVYARAQDLAATGIFSAPDSYDVGRLIVVLIAENPGNAENIKKSLLVTKNRLGREIGVDVIIAVLDDPETLNSGFFVEFTVNL